MNTCSYLNEFIAEQKKFEIFWIRPKIRILLITMPADLVLMST